MEAAMFWLISLFSPILYLVLSVSSVNFFVVEKNIIGFLVLGIVPGTNIQFDFYFIFLSLILLITTILLFRLMKSHKLNSLQKLLFSNKQDRLKNISI